MLSRRVSSTLTHSERLSLQRQWLQSGKCFRCFHASRASRADQGHKKDGREQATPYNAPNRGPTRQQRAAMVSKEVRMLARDTPSLGPSRPPNDSADFTVGPQSLGNDAGSERMGENMAPEREGPLAQGLGRLVRSQDVGNDADDTIHIRETRTPRSAIEEPTEGGAAVMHQRTPTRNTDQRPAQEEDEAEEDEEGEEEYEDPPALVTRRHQRPVGKRLPTPGIPFTPETISKEHFIHGNPGSSTIAAANFEGIISARFKAVIEPGQDQSSRDPHLLAQKVLSRQLVRFESQEEKTAVMHAVREITGHWKSKSDQERAAKVALLKEKGRDLDSYFKPIREGVRNIIVDKMAKGVYDAEGILDGKQKYKQPVLNEIATMTMKNETYLNEDGERLLRKVQSLLPAVQTQGAQQAQQRRTGGKQKQQARV